MGDLQREAEHWREKITDDINLIYDLKDHALKQGSAADAEWHEKLSRVTSDLRLLSAWLGHFTAREGR
jgi:hypothetical protein